MSREELIAVVIAAVVAVLTRLLDRWLPKDADTTGKHIRPPTPGPASSSSEPDPG